MGEDKVKDNPMVVPGTREDPGTRADEGVNYSILVKIISRFITGFFLYNLAEGLLFGIRNPITDPIFLISSHEKKHFSFLFFSIVLCGGS